MAKAECNRQRVGSRKARGLRWLPLALGFLAWQSLGCAEIGPTRDVHLLAPAAVRAVAADSPADAQVPAQATAKVLPIDLDTVFRLAGEQNPQIALAREKVAEAYAEKDVASTRWLPDTYVGTGYYRHEGGIQNEDGRLTHSSFGALFSGLEINSLLDLHKVMFEQINAERAVWQQKGELSRITNETLLEATETYIDLLSAYEGRELARRLKSDVEGLRKRAQDLYKVEKSESVRMEVTRLEAEMASRNQTLVKLRQQTAAASAKLVYLLGIDPCTELVPVDGRLVRLNLVDATPSCDDLVAQAMANGPGVRELEGMLAVIHQGLERSQGPGRFMPIFEMHMAEGAFGAGPGDQMSWDNRWDLGVQARWNLTDLFTSCDRQRVARSKLQQVHLSYQDLRGKLAAGVESSRSAILDGDEELTHDNKQIEFAEQTFKISNERLKNRIQGSSYSEVLLSLQSRALAELNRLQDLRAYDKAQLRLLLLLGSGRQNHAHTLPNPQ